MTGTTVLAEGGFNTGRLYTRHGQRVYWWRLDDGTVYFYDVDRMCDAYVAGTGRGDVNPYWLMARYDAGGLERCHESRFDQGARERIPEGFDFGPMLRI